MPSLYDAYLPIIQDINNCGGNFTAFHISRPVLDTIDAGAGSDQALAALRGKIFTIIQNWKGLQDHETFSALFETYHEAVFYLVARHRKAALKAVPAGASKGKTPDFTTLQLPTIGFEVKTIDIADPKRTYDKTMEDGLNAKIEATAHAKRTGAGFAESVIRPHGDAKDQREMVEQVMKKIDGNVKMGQYAATPTFLVVSVARTALGRRADDLRKWLPGPYQAHDVNGHLFEIAAHTAGESFYFSKDNFRVGLGPIERAGVLLDHPFIAGLIFMNTEWNLSGEVDAIERAFRLNGIWNSEWERTNTFALAEVAAAKRTFEQLCHAWNDTQDSRSALLPAR